MFDFQFNQGGQEGMDTGLTRLFRVIETLPLPQFLRAFVHVPMSCARLLYSKKSRSVAKDQGG